MGLNRRTIGSFIEAIDERNSFGLRSFYGLDKSKSFIPTKALTGGLDESKYKVVRYRRFVFSGMQTGRDKCIRIGLSVKEDPFIVSPAYTTFEVVDPDVDPTYFFMRFQSSEMDRLGWFYSDGSIRSNLDWDVFCNIEIELPPIEVQRKYAAVYEAMLANQRFYEQGLDDLKTICFSTIERFRREMPLKPIGNYVRTYNEKNSDGAITLEQGVNIQKQFITPQRPNSNLLGRKIVRHGQFAYCTQLNNANVAIAIREGCDCVVSSVYDVFEITKTDELLADYLMLWLIRPEFGRYVYWASIGSAYEFLSFENLANYKIPVPTIAEQKSVADIYQVYKKRYAINERLKSRLRDICPVLIRGSIEEASR